CAGVASIFRRWSMTTLLRFPVSEPTPLAPAEVSSSRRHVLRCAASLALVGMAGGCVRAEEARDSDPLAAAVESFDPPRGDKGSQEFGEKVRWLLQVVFDGKVELPKSLDIRRVPEPS